MRPLPLFVFFMFTNEKPVPRTLKTAIPEEAERGPDPAEDGSSLGAPNGAPDVGTPRGSFFAFSGTNTFVIYIFG